MSIDKPMAGLIMAAKGSPAPTPKASAGTCVRLLIPLSNQEFFCDTDPEVVPGFIALRGGVYSEVRGKDGVMLAIKRHHGLQIMGTGAVKEVVVAPDWWAKRDEGMV